MRKMRIFAALSLVLLLPALASAQLKSPDKPASFSQLLTQGLSAPRSLIGMIGLNPNRFSMQQSYSLSYLSAGGQGFSQGVYLNTMSYRFSDPLQVSLQWGIMNQPLSSLGVPSMYSSGFFLSGANLEYKPSKNMSVGIQFNSYPAGSYYPYRAGYYPYYDYSPSRSDSPSSER